MNSQINSSDPTAQVSKIQERRNALKEMSVAVKPLVESQKFSTINQAIINTFYKVDGHETFKTFEQWKKEGKFVQKGSKAFVVWGSKIERQTEDDDEEKSSYWPVCYLFSNLQVADRG